MMLRQCIFLVFFIGSSLYGISSNVTVGELFYTEALPTGKGKIEEISIHFASHLEEELNYLEELSFLFHVENGIKQTLKPDTMYSRTLSYMEELLFEEITEIAKNKHFSGIKQLLEDAETFEYITTRLKPSSLTDFNIILHQLGRLEEIKKEFQASVLKDLGKELEHLSSLCNRAHIEFTFYEQLLEGAFASLLDKGVCTSSIQNTILADYRRALRGVQSVFVELNFLLQLGPIKKLLCELEQGKEQDLYVFIDGQILKDNQLFPIVNLAKQFPHKKIAVFFLGDISKQYLEMVPYSNITFYTGGLSVLPSSGCRAMQSFLLDVWKGLNGRLAAGKRVLLYDLTLETSMSSFTQGATTFLYNRLKGDFSGRHTLQLLTCMEHISYGWGYRLHNDWMFHLLDLRDTVVWFPSPHLTVGMGLTWYVSSFLPNY